MMKNFIFLFIFILMAAFQAHANHYKIQADGMMCPACVEILTDGFMDLEGVETVTITLENQNIMVETLDNITLTDDQASNIITRHGYKFLSMDDVSQ